MLRPMSIDRRGHQGALALVLAIGLVGCGASPLAPRTVVPVPAAFREAPQAAAFAVDPPPMGVDWRAFADPLLDAWLAQAVVANPSLAETAARVDRAAAALGLAEAGRRPAVDGQWAGSRRQGALVNDAGSRGNLFQGGLSLRWDADLFGQLTRQQQVAAQDVLAQQALHAQARLTLQADVSQAYLAWRMTRLEAAVLDAVLVLDQGLSAAAARRVQAGLAPPSHHEAALAEYQADAIARQHLRGREARWAHALVALAGGQEVVPLDDLPAVALADPSDIAMKPVDATVGIALPDVPAGLPSQMLRRRPDVAAAEARLQAARLRLGLARDRWFPSLVLTAQAGQASGELGQWLQAAARSSAVGLVLSLPVFDGGRRDADQAVALAQLHEATAAHRARVLAALREVDDRLAAVRTSGDAARLQARNVALSGQAQARALRQWREGLVSATQAWESCRAALRQQQLWVQAEAARGEATVALVLALGGSSDVASPVPVREP